MAIDLGGAALRQQPSNGARVVSMEYPEQLLVARTDEGAALTVARAQLQQTPSPESWARIIEALNKHHPQWIDGNGSAVDKIVKFIEGAK